MMKMALGLFHFNPHWGADAVCRDRHCNESLGPFLKILERHPSWKLSVELSGSGIEILAKYYNHHFTRLRRLVHSGQIELISALYTPSLWIAFPKHDLVKSIERNRETLKQYGLPINRIFFAQEGFFGDGVRGLADYFDIAICKDDYLNYLYDLPYQHIAWRMGDMRVIVASGHLLGESVSIMRDQPGALDTAYLSYRHTSYIDDIKYFNEPSHFPARAGCIEALEWLWYHCGDGNHFTCIAKPWDREKSFYDFQWAQWNETLLMRIEDSGFRLSHIAELANSIPSNSDPLMPTLLEAGWNPHTSNGVARWMGAYAQPWENDNLILTTVARARLRLLAAERYSKASEDMQHGWEKRIDDAWDKILSAQCSDFLGWSPSPAGVAAGIAAAEDALRSATEIASTIMPYAAGMPEPSGILDTGLELPPAHEPTLFGAIGKGGWVYVASNCWMWEIRFRSTERECGLRFPFNTTELAFSPSGSETEIVRVPLGALRPEVLSLPLANGLLQVGREWFLIKDTTRVHVAARIEKPQQTVAFAISGARPGQEYLWAFYLVKGEHQALECANRINGGLVC